MRTLKASKTPVDDINKIAYPGQAPKMRQYRSGYEDMFNQMPILDPDDPDTDAKVELTNHIMQEIGHKLVDDEWVEWELVPSPGEFNRTILALVPPIKLPHIDGIPDMYKAGTQIIVARWGDGRQSPVHGHAPGYIHEEILFGKIRVDTYRLTERDDIVRPLQRQLVGKGTFVSLFDKQDPNSKFYRQTLIHNYTSVGNAASLHYLPEYTRDGRDNVFKVEYFDQANDLLPIDVDRITAEEALHSAIGDVILVRSKNVPYMGEHYIIITGPPIEKDHGFRPQDHAIPADHNTLLKSFSQDEELVLLKLKDYAAWVFLHFHDITLRDGQVIFPHT